MEQRVATLEKWKEETVKWMHQKDISDSKKEGQISELRKDMDELLENSRWMKRAWMKGMIALVVSVTGTVLTGIGGLIWYLATK